MENVNSEFIESLIKKEEYEKIKKYCYSFIRNKENSVMDKFNLACILSEFDKTKDLSEMILCSLINSYLREYVFNKLISIYKKEGNFKKIKELFELNYYEPDSEKLILLSKIEKNLENYDDASLYLNEVLSYPDYDDLNYLYELILLEIKKGNIEEAYKILINNECLKYHELYNYIFTYLNVKSGNETQMNNNQYYLKQIVKYDEKSAKKYIKNHRVIGNCKIFKNVDINSLFEKCKDCIQNLKPIYSDYMDRYVIKFDSNIGIAYNSPTQYVFVSTLLNEKNIMFISSTSMYLENENVGDITIKNNNRKKQLEYKRESQIEKFNRKYQM